MENKALRWQINILIPLSRLKEAIANGYTDIWDLADYFEVSEDFMRQAILYYKIGLIV